MRIRTWNKVPTLISPARTGFSWSAPIMARQFRMESANLIRYGTVPPAILTRRRYLLNPIIQRRGSTWALFPLLTEIEPFGTLFGKFDVNWVPDGSKPVKACRTPLSMVVNPPARNRNKRRHTGYRPFLGDTSGHTPPAPSRDVDVSNVIHVF